MNFASAHYSNENALGARFLGVETRRGCFGQRNVAPAKRAGRRKGQMVFHVVAGHYPIRNGGEGATLRSLGVNREDGAVEGLLAVSGALTRGLGLQKNRSVAST